MGMVSPGGWCFFGIGVNTTWRRRIFRCFRPGVRSPQVGVPMTILRLPEWVCNLPSSKWMQIDLVQTYLPPRAPDRTLEYSCGSIGPLVHRLLAMTKNNHAMSLSLPSTSVSVFAGSCVLSKICDSSAWRRKSRLPDSQSSGYYREPMKVKGACKHKLVFVRSPPVKQSWLVKYV